MTTEQDLHYFRGTGLQGLGSSVTFSQTVGLIAHDVLEFDIHQLTCGRGFASRWLFPLSGIAGSSTRQALLLPMPALVI